MVHIDSLAPGSCAHLPLPPRQTGSHEYLEYCGHSTTPATTATAPAAAKTVGFPQFPPSKELPLDFMGTTLLDQKFLAGGMQPMHFRPAPFHRPDLICNQQLTGSRHYSDEYQLSIRQEPERAKVVIRGKEKGEFS